MKKSNSNRNARRTLLMLAGALPWWLAACGGGDDAPPPSAPAPSAPPPAGSGSNVAFGAKAVTDNLVDAVITQTYRDLNARSTALLDAILALQAVPASEPAMDAAQAAWQAARLPWESSEGFLFGPVDALGIDPAIDSWPLNTADLAAFLAVNPTATQADVENAGDDLRGFHAIEYLLFGDGTTDNDKAAAELTPEELNYLVALVRAFKARTDELEQAWTTDFNGRGPYALIVKSPGATNSSYASYGAVLQELINGIVGIADEAGNTKLAGPLGATLADADTSQVESQFSWNSLTDFHDNLHSVMNIYTGKLGFDWRSDTVGGSLNGLYAFVAAHDTTVATRVLQEIRDAQRRIALIKGDGNDTTTAISATASPFRNQILNATGRSLVEAAIAACNTLKTTLESDVLPMVGRTTFSA